MGMATRGHNRSHTVVPDSILPERAESRYSALPLSDIVPVLPLMERWGVSTVARSRRGFLTAYQKVRGRLSALRDTVSPKQQRPWTKVREEFIARHLAQVKEHGEKLWDKDGLPTRRHLALVAWAYTPNKERWRRFVERVRLREVEALRVFERLGVQPRPVQSGLNLPRIQSGTRSVLGVAPQMAGTVDALIRPDDPAWPMLERHADRVLWEARKLDLGERIACGAYGCVYTLHGSPKEVLKLTSDASEAAAVHRVLISKDRPKNLDHFLDVMAIAGTPDLYAVRVRKLEPLTPPEQMWLSDPTVVFSLLTALDDDLLSQVSLDAVLDSAREAGVDTGRVLELRDTMRYLAEVGIQWMDLSAENVMRDRSGHWRIADPGASLLDPEHEDISEVSSDLLDDLDIAFSQIDGGHPRTQPKVERHSKFERPSAEQNRLGGFNRLGKPSKVTGRSVQERPKGYPEFQTREIIANRIEDDDDSSTWPGIRPEEDSERFMEWSNKAYDVLLKLGFRVDGPSLGCGSYGCAYRGRPYVVKFTTDPAEVANAQTVLAAGGVEGVINFFAIYAFRRVPGMFVVLMEEVEPISSGVKKWINQHNLYVQFWNYYHRDIAAKPITRKELDGYCERFLRAGAEKGYDGSKLVEGLHNLYRLGITPEDVHGGNVMLRRRRLDTGKEVEELVILDLGHSEGPKARVPEVVG